MTIDDLIPVAIDYIRPYSNHGTHFVGLKGEDNQVIAIVPIGEHEAMDLHAMLNKLTKRPTAHLLLLEVVERLKGKIARLIIHDLEGDHYRNKLLIQGPEHNHELDCRLSDGLMISLLSHAQMYVTQQAIDAVPKNPDKSNTPPSNQVVAFNDEVKKVMGYSREESARLGHNYIGTEHILLGLIKDEKNKSVEILTRFGLSMEMLRLSIDDYVATTKKQQAKGVIPFTPRAKKILEVASYEAHHVASSYVGVEHLLLALLKDKEGVAAQVLAAFGVDYEKVRVLFAK